MRELYAIALALSLLAFSGAALVAHALVCLTQRGSSALKRHSGKQMLVSMASLLTGSVAAGAQVLLATLSGLLRWWLFFGVVLALFSTVHVTYTEYPEVWLEGVRFYNAAVGPYVHQLLIVPLQVADVMLRALLPLWNSALWFAKALAVQGLLPILIEEAKTVLQMAGALMQLVTHLSAALFAFVDGFTCSGAECLYPEAGVLDLLSSLGSMREFVALGVRLLNAVCGTLSAPLDILVYPLLDLNLAEGLHSLGNAALQLAVVIPRATWERCRLAGGQGGPFDLMMCTPDFTPFFNLLVAGLGSLGLAVDNWINIAFLIVRQAVTGVAGPACDSEYGGRIPDILADAKLFPGGESVVVGLTQWTYAVTDGITAIYAGHSNLDVRSQQWLFPMDLAFGFAAVTYSTVHDLDVSTLSSGVTTGASQTNDLLGCNCTNTPDGPLILCSILPFAGVPSGSTADQYLLQVLFPDLVTPTYLSCEGVDIYVKSVRWPYTRYTRPGAGPATVGSSQTTLATTDCVSRGTCRETDASVWVVPRCGQDAPANSLLACIPSAACFPFCMAVRPSGGGRDNLLLAGAGRWRTGLTVLARDCGLADTSPQMMQPTAGASGTTSTVPSSRGDMLGAAGLEAPIYAFPPGGRVCQPAARVRSVVASPKLRVAANVMAAGQPFVIVGDAVLTELDLGGKQSTVLVERLGGDETNVFSLAPLGQGLPSVPKTPVPSEQASYDDGQHVLIPYSYQTTAQAAVASRDYVFYASNPSMDTFSGYLAYCSRPADDPSLPQMAVQFESSYAPIMIYRISAYRRCSASACGADLVRRVQIPSFLVNLTRHCDQAFNASVLALEYLNEDNIAVTLLETTVTQWQAGTGTWHRGPGSQTRTRTLWLNPSTMQVRSAIWQTVLPSSTHATLCPSQQVLPRVGSFTAEVLLAGLFLVRTALFAVLYTPAMVPIWSGVQPCPDAAGGSYHHGVLANCGSGLYSMEDYFDTLDDAASLFWHSLTLLGQLVAPAVGEAASPLTDVLAGMELYGRGTVNLWTARASVMTLTKLPVREGLQDLWGAVRAGTGHPQPAALAGQAASAICRFSVKHTTALALAMVQAIMKGTSMSATEAWRLMWSEMYDARAEFTASVTRKSHLGCAGLRQLFGLGNPWSDLIYYQCVATTELIDNFFQLGLNLFVQIPMVKCVCKDTSGEDLMQFVQSTCKGLVPTTLLPTLYTIAGQANGQYHLPGLACASLLDTVRLAINSSMDPWFETQYRGLDALGGAIDYAMFAFEKDAGRCSDFAHDPHAVVIVPYPFEYFQGCAKTSRCKSMCAGQWANFQAAALPPVPQPEMSVATESLFFPGQLDAALQLSNASASMEVNGTGLCLARAGLEPQDLAIAVAEVEGLMLTVSVWCVPLTPSSSVYKAPYAGFGPANLPGDVLRVSFGGPDWVALLLHVAGVQVVAWLDLGGLHFPFSPASYLRSDQDYVGVMNLWCLAGVMLVDVVTRQLSGVETAMSTGHVTHLSLLPGPHNTTHWHATDVDLVSLGTGHHWITSMPDGSTWFLPQMAGSIPFRSQFWQVDGALAWSGLQPQPPMDLSALKGLTLASASLSQDRILATATTGWDWLSEVRLGEGYVLGVFNSATIQMTIQPGGNCNELSCEGCANLQLQRLCLAYGKCSLINCVGTPVHQRKPLCGVGGLLKHTGDMALRSTHAAWVVFSEMLGLVLSLRLLHPREAQLMWPEDSFMCYVCAAKDGSAEFFSILTATLNMALQLSGANVGFLYGGASNVNRNADAVLTLGATALNGFMHQIALLPLFLMIASHQVMLCQTVGVVALLDSTSSFKIRLLPPDQTSDSDIITGRCLTVGASALTQYPTDSKAGLGAVVASLAASAVDLLLVSQFEPILHYIDMGLSYLMGVLDSFAVLLTSQSMAQCNPPDFSMRVVVTCACGDRPLSIQASRRAQDIQARAHWCSGVLSMLDGAGQPMFVYNPYTYDQVREKAAGMQAYLDCVSQGRHGYSCVPPADPVFKPQGVNVLNVLVACRENYVNERWDPAAFVLYGRPAGYPLKAPAPIPDEDPCQVRECLQRPLYASGSLAQECLQQYLGCVGVTSDDYFAYEHATADGPQFVDACLVFSGPALASPLSPFAACVDGPDEGLCTLPGHCWTPQSASNVPVCEQHHVLSSGGHLDGTVQNLYRAAQTMVQQAVQDSIAAQSGSHAVMSFFSVEGDVLHQTADCMFMGPYSRVDYWPLPVCNPGEECLAGPYWSRDEGAGGTRRVDINACPAETTLPYTCGSVARRSLMRFFVNTVLTGNGAGKNKNMSAMQEILLNTLHGVASDWSNVSRFGCACGPNATEFLPSCCAAGSELLQPLLNKTFSSISTDTVLLAIEDDFEEMFEWALDSHIPWFSTLDLIKPGTRRSYDWRASQRAEDEARLSPVDPSLSYTRAEAMTPVLSSSSSMWDLCHGALKQLLFTMPLTATGLQFDSLDPFDGNMSRIEEYVRAFTKEALLRSPLYRHYVPRHAPSDSQMCGSGPSAETAQGAVTWDSFVQADTTLLDNSKGALPPLAAFGPQRFRVGEAGCLCGWRRVKDRCQAPAGDTCTAVCKTVRCADCWYNASLDGTLVAQFDPAWACPEVEISPHWGVLDADGTDKWLAGNLTALNGSTRDLLTHGRAGLRVGNLATLRARSKAYISPKTREVPLEKGRLTGCPSNTPPWSNDLSQAFVEQLFPAAQGVEEAGAVAYCLRYVIEVARFTALDLVDPAASATLAQRETVERWRVRCGAQLQVVTLCAGLDVYRPRSYGTDRRCPHFTATGLTGDDYTTPECLVRVGGAYYDPCRCVPCLGERATLVAASSFTRPECRIRFDPRDIAPPGAPIGYVDGVGPDLPAPSAGFASAALDDPDAAANALPGAQWWSSEGWMSNTSEFCDMVQDWWPEWDFPVGYHVTVPCDADDTSYRTFMQAFAVDRSGAQPTLVYQHDLMRDATLADSVFGAGGLCRTTNFGMPMPVTNTMRYCTSVPTSGEEDFTIPGLHESDPSPAFTDWQCAQDSTDLPWPDWAHAAGGAYASSQYSVGTVPNMPPTAADRTYPASPDGMSDLGPWQELELAGHGWSSAGGKACSDFALYLCLADADCPTGFACKGRMCSNDMARKCTADINCTQGGACQGICMDQATECRRHDDCPGTTSMCSGVGTCETPTLVLVNTLPVDATLQMQVPSACPAGSTPFSLSGGSYYAHPSTDVLRAHGMCSFEDWFRYTFMTAGQCATSLSTADYLDIDPSACAMLYVEDPPANQSRWWVPGKSRPDFMYLRPTNCDRDYERLAGFQQCAPTPGFAEVLDVAGSHTTVVQRDQFVRLHESSGSIRLAVMPESTTRVDYDVGFLGLGRENNITRIDQMMGDGGNNFITCASLSQCYPPDFTVQGVRVVRNVTDPDSGLLVPYPPGDAFKCGTFGVQKASTGRCTVDRSVMQLYWFLCGPGLIPSCKLLFDRAQTERIRLCAAVLPYYEPQNSQRVANLKALTDLFHMFPSFSTFDRYLDVVQCSLDLYQGLNGASLYYPFMYSLYEVPFDWFYQCLVMAGSSVNPSFRGSQDCAQFRQRGSFSITKYVTTSLLDDNVTFLQRVAGGYTRAYFDAYRAEQTRSVVLGLKIALNATRALYYSSPLADRSYPLCSKHRLWKVGKYGSTAAAYKQVSTGAYSYRKRQLIANLYNTQQCKSTWQVDLTLKEYGIANYPWIADNTFPDPDPANWIPDPMYTRYSMLDLLMERLSGSFGVSYPSVASGTAGPSSVLFETDMMEAGSILSFLDEPKNAFLFPAEDQPGAEVDMAADESDMTCAFQKEDDPRFPFDKSSCVQDAPTLTAAGFTTYYTRCGNPTCVPAPMRYAANGLYSCGYKSDSGDLPACTADNRQACVSEVASALLASLRRNYMPPAKQYLPAAALPWFGRQWAFSFDLSTVLDYQSNIQPNPSLAVMCEITTNPDAAVQFMQCHNEHYSTLKAHVDSTYRRDGAPIAPAGTQLEWWMDRPSLTQGFILSYASANRSLALRFLDSLFDDNTVCKDPVVDNQRVCWKNATGQFNSVNPWLLGNFNPFHMCDVSFVNQNQQLIESIYATCSDKGEPNPICVEYGTRQVQAQCRPQHGHLVTMPGVPPIAHGGYPAYNLCHHTLNEDSSGCMEDIGLLGGFNGLPVTAPSDAYNMLRDTKYAGSPYTVGPNLYEDSEWAIPDDFQGGIFAGTNPLWAGSGNAPFGYLRVNGTELGGHRIGLTLSRAQPDDAISVLRVTHLPLSAEQTKTPVGWTGSRTVDQWVPGLQASMAADGASNLRRYGSNLPPARIGATCPMQRWAFYSGAYTAFAPTLPSPVRARHLFFPLHGGLLAHPTMQQDSSGGNLGLYKSANGFCACPVMPDIPQMQCLTDVTLGEQCSLQETVELLAGLKGYGTTHAYQPFNAKHTPQPCGMQLDWPNLNRTLRDGAAHAGERWADASSPSNRQCHVLDRFRPFRYKYVSVSTLGPSKGNTVSRGTCQTGRAVTLDRTQLPAGRCLRKTLSPSGATFVCTTPTTAPPFMSRPQPPAPPVTASRRRTKRQRCSQCAAPPSFVSQKGAPIPPESSFGRLFRQSTERTLAKDLRDALCNVTGVCPDFNRSAWARGRFMRNYLTNPASLFRWPARPVEAPSRPTPEPASVWEGKGWVYCPDTASLRTGEGCKGTMPRAQWVANRSAVCSSMVRSFSTANGTTPVNPMARTPFCSIDASTDTLCQRIVEARALVAQANCIARGTDTSCLPKPFVYHPASYVPSNNEWVHNTVNQFYNQLEGGTCPNDQVINFTLSTAYQAACPASAVNLFVGILQILRYVVTDIATLLATLISMATRLLAMLFTQGPNVHNMRASLGADWAIVRKKAGQSMSAVSDLLVDTLLNSGAMGQRLMQFMDALCENGNWAINWFLDVWCNYVKEYMISLLAGLQQAMGIIGTGFEIVNDLMDYLFAGMLPAEFALKYGSELFQTLMTERYEKPKAHSDKVKAANVPLKADARPLAGASAARNAEASAVRTGQSSVSAIASDSTKMMSRTGKIVQVLGTGGAIVGFALQIPDMVNQINDMAARAAPHFFPSNFTLFKISDIVNIITDMSGFLQEDDTCYTFQVLRRHNYSYVFLQCLKLDMSAYAGSGQSTTFGTASLCWADAQQGLGQNSLMSCTVGSTCCRTSECLDFIPCGSCPAAPGPGSNQYGCNGLRQRCVCGQAVSLVTSCSSNGQCDVSAQCDLTSTTGSYGTTPCGQCPVSDQVMCMLQPAGLPGQCTCLMASSLRYALCTDESGTQTVADPGKMCGYVPGYSARATAWAFAMDDLLLVPCSQAKAVVCSTVSTATGQSLRMAVAVTVRSGGGRRLLTFDDPDPEDWHDADEALDPETLAEVLGLGGWERVAQPCRSLVAAHQAREPLGILDTLALHQCAYWRFVGRHLVERFNLTALEDRDTFLLSWQDLALALADPDAARALAGSLAPAWRAVLYHPWMRPVRALAMRAEAYLTRVRWGQLFRHAQRRVERATDGWQEARDAPDATDGGARRRLLQSVQDDLQGVLAYTAQVIKGAPSAAVPTLVASAWSTADFVWPPAYNFSLSECPAGLSILRLAQQVVRIDMLYYQHFANTPLPPIDRSLRANLPRLTGWAANASVDLTPRAGGWPSTAFHAMLGLLRVQPSQLVAFFTTAEENGFRWMLETAIRCDLASVNTCARHKRDILMSTVVFALLFVLLTAVGGALGMPMVGTLLLLSYPSFILWYAFGVAPTCFPLVPTCLLSDVIATVGYLAPAQLVLPPALLQPGGLVPCERLNFTSWPDTLAFVLCDTDRSTCEAARGFRAGIPTLDRLWAPLQTAISRLGPVLDADGYEPHAHRVCAWVSFVWVVPLLAAGVLAAVLAYAATSALVALVPTGAAFLGQLVLFYQSE
jgi:hypothetical protein